MVTAMEPFSEHAVDRPVERWIIGNPANRRVRDYQSAASASGLSVPECLPWRSLLEAPTERLKRIGDDASMRIDSPGEDAEVICELIRLGGSRAIPRHGEIMQMDRQFRGFVRVLEQIRDWADRHPHVTVQNAPADIAVMFDKWASHERFHAADLERPPTCRLPMRSSEFRRMRHEIASPRSGRLFLKPRYASSASGVCAYRWSADREQIIAPIELVRDEHRIALYNSLRIRSYTRPEEIEAILDRLLPQQMIAERWVQKARVEGKQFDLRIVVIANRAAHLVVRQSRWPMTNLHLGNERGDWDVVRSEMGEAKAQQCFDVALQAATCFPNSLYAGVDVIVPMRGQPFVCEINAFGDLLPGVIADGQSVYQAILNAEQRRLSRV